MLIGSSQELLENTANPPLCKTSWSTRSVGKCAESIFLPVYPVLRVLTERDQDHTPGQHIFFTGNDRCLHAGALGEISYLGLHGAVPRGGFVLF